MKDLYQILEKYLLNPNKDENIDEFAESDALFWVDWREYDENIVDYVNEYLQENEQIGYHLEVDEDKNVHIFLFYPKTLGGYSGKRIYNF